MTKVREQLTDLGEWLGVDGVQYIKAVKLFEDFQQMADEGNTDAAYIINALHYVHKAIARA